MSPAERETPAGEAKTLGAVSIRCPKCKGATFVLFEKLEVADRFPVRNGIAQPKCADEGMPTQIGFSAKCVCGHFWTPRYTSAMAIIDAEHDARQGARP